MSVKDKISSDLKTAMKAKDAKRVGVLRMMLSEIKYAQAATNAQTELPEDQVLKVLTSYHKRLTKALDDYPEGERRDELKGEIEIVEGYLPRRATPEEVEKAVAAVLEETSDRTFGPLMKQVMSRLGEGADGKMVSQILRQKLGG